METVKKRLKILWMHLGQRVGRREQINYPKAYRPARKEVRCLGPYLRQSRLELENIFRGVLEFSKTITRFTQFLDTYVHQEREFNLDVAQKIEKFSHTLKEIPVNNQNLIADLRKKYMQTTTKLEYDVNQSTRIHNDFKLELGQFETLAAQTEALKAKAKRAPADSQHDHVRRIQKNVSDLERRQQDLDALFFNANLSIQQLLHDRNTQHIQSLFDILMSLYTYFEEGMTAIDKVRPWMESELESIERVKAEFVAPEKPSEFEEHHTWSVDDFKPEDFLTSTLRAPPQDDGLGGDGDEEEVGEGGAGAVGDIPKVPIGTCIAKYDFSPQEPGELPFKKSEKIFVLVMNEGDWCTGINESGQIGEFPSNYIDGTMSEAEHTSALFKYTATEENELSFEQGDKLVVLHRDPDGWWIGCLAKDNGLEIGTFPCNYCELGKGVRGGGDDEDEVDD